MRLGGPKTHDYPKGKPLLLTILDALDLPLIVIPGVFIIDSRRWLWLLPLVLSFVGLIFIHRKLLKHYVSSGRAVPISRSVAVVRYQHGRPRVIKALRIAFVLDVAMMLAFGIGPFTHETAKIALICLVLLLFGIAIAYVLVERHYVRTGVAREIKSTCHCLCASRTDRFVDPGTTAQRYSLQAR